MLSHERVKIKKYCRKTVSSNKNVPIIEYVTAGVWAVISNTLIEVTILCKYLTPKQNVIKTKPPITLISLNNSCRAVSAYFHIPEYYTWEKQIKYSDSLASLLQRYEIHSYEFLELINNDFNNVSSITIPESLLNIKELPMQTFLGHIQTRTVRQSIANENQRLNPWTSEKSKF